MIFENSKDNPITLFYGVWEDLFTIGFGTNAAQWKKNTERHICRLCYYLLLKSKTELLHNFDDFKISQYQFWAPALLSCNYQRQFYWSKKRKKNSSMINSWNVKSPISYRKHTEQTHMFLLPLLRSWCNRSIRATIGQKMTDHQQQINLKIFTSTVDGMNLLFRCSCEKSKSYWISNFS